MKTLTRNATNFSAILFGFALLTQIAHSQNLLRNPSFESVPDGSHGQGLLPSDWLDATGGIVPWADTYSNDGSYGLPTNNGGHFPGVTAPDGIRWVAGGFFPAGSLGSASDHTYSEAFGQLLTAPLVPDTTYTFSALLHQDMLATGYGANYPGGYDVFLSPTSSVSDPSAVFVARLSRTTGLDAWEERATYFIAPHNAADLLYIILSPYSMDSTIRTYPAIDNLSLQTAPTPATTVEASIHTAVEVFWQAEVGHYYQVQSTPSLSNPNWSNVGSVIAGDGTEKSTFDTTRNRDKRFYRVMKVQ